VLASYNYKDINGVIGKMSCVRVVSFIILTF
jgi:hypothetical protein